MKSNPFSITIDRQVIKLLGAHLYGDTPSVINELIANSYDAGAKRIWISLKTSYPYQLKVQDDGIGMDVADINNYYLNIGYNRRTASALQQDLSENGIERMDMGQKGIGKLAVFALSKIVKIVSYKNRIPVGCLMDFDTICQKDGQPQPFDIDQIYQINENNLSPKGSGTLIILENVVKNLGKSYKFIVSSIARSFILNNKEVQIFIQKDNEEFKEIKRGRLDYFKFIDVLATIGDKYTYIGDAVRNNQIDCKYKRIIKYEDLVEETKTLRESKKFDSLPKTLKVYNKDKSSQLDFAFSFHGWIGTVQNEESFKSILHDDGYTDEDLADKEIIVADDNRISIYSRGKIGEYNILPKLKTKAANDAYIVGEIFVDDFEDDALIDMATSNRRGYQEDDIRYETLCHNLKLLVSSGDFIIKVLLEVNPALKSRIVFTSNPQFGLMKGRNIFDELKECFRPDYYIVFLFTKSFYDSNPCLAEAGAAWATNRKYMNIVVDIPFNDIDKPLDNSINGAIFDLETNDHIIQFAQALQTVLETVDQKYDLERIISIIRAEKGNYKFTLPSFIPKRKYQVYPICEHCGRPLIPQSNTTTINYVCECGQEIHLNGKIT